MVHRPLTDSIGWGIILELFALHYIPHRGARSPVQTEQAMPSTGAWGRAAAAAADELTASVGQLYVPQVCFLYLCERTISNGVPIREKSHLH